MSGEIGLWVCYNYQQKITDKTDLHYIAVKKFTLGDEVIPLFIVTENSSQVSEFVKGIKAQDGVQVGKGTCDVLKDGTTRKVVGAVI